MFSVRMLGRRAGVCCYSVSSKRVPIIVPAKPQEQRHALPEEGSVRSRVPKFTMAQAEFLTADLFAQERQMVQVPRQQGGERASFKTVTELLRCQGQTAEEARVPHQRLQQIYAAPASVFMRINATAMVPESQRLGPLAEPLLGRDTFTGGLSTLGMDGEAMDDFVGEFFDAIQSGDARMWSVRGQRRAAREEHGWRVERFYAGTRTMQMSSVKRKRRAKMNKHKLQKLRKRNRAERKRLNK
ncbi:hypothetical protein GGF46_001047 [Coemansia sp. RSA 552]|nr:hypothetical protein GGF46_001047 [Coemansia sp. RSA 552]